MSVRTCGNWIFIPQNFVRHLGYCRTTKTTLKDVRKESVVGGGGGFVPGRRRIGHSTTFVSDRNTTSLYFVYDEKTTNIHPTNHSISSSSSSSSFATHRRRSPSISATHLFVLPSPISYWFSLSLVPPKCFCSVCTWEFSCGSLCAAPEAVRWGFSVDCHRIVVVVVHLLGFHSISFSLWSLIPRWSSRTMAKPPYRLTTDRHGVRYNRSE